MKCLVCKQDMNKLKDIYFCIRCNKTYQLKKCDKCDGSRIFDGIFVRCLNCGATRIAQ